MASTSEERARQEASDAAYARQLMQLELSRAAGRAPPTAALAGAGGGGAGALPPPIAPVVATGSLPPQPPQHHHHHQQHPYPSDPAASSWLFMNGQGVAVHRGAGGWAVPVATPVSASQQQQQQQQLRQQQQPGGADGGPAPRVTTVVGVPLRTSVTTHGGLTTVTVSDARDQQPVSAALVMLLRRVRAVKIYALIDLFFLLFYGLSLPPVMLLLIGPVMGFYGASRLIKWPLIVYQCFLILTLLLRAVLVYFYFMSGQFLWLLVAVLGILVEAFVLRQVWAVIYSIKLLSAADLARVRSAAARLGVC